MVKRAYIEKYPNEANNYVFIKDEKLSGILRYIDEKDALQSYYDDLDTLLPKYYFIKDEQEQSYIATEWKEHDTIVFPPFLDYVLFHQTDGVIKVISYGEFVEKFNKQLLDVPGFLQDTKVIPKKHSKSINKKTKKMKWTPITKSFTKQSLNIFMDL